MSTLRCAIAALLIPAASLAAPVDNFVTCAARYAAMDLHSGERGFGRRAGLFDELVDAAGGSADGTPLRRAAEADVVYLLHQRQWAWTAAQAQGADRALRRMLRECDQLVL